MRDGPDGFFVFTHTTLPQRPPTTQTPHKQQLQFDYQGGSLGFADGGGVDNTAIIPLLRRRCTRIIAGTATVESPAASNATAWAASQWDVAGLFGAVKAHNARVLVRRAALTRGLHCRGNAPAVASIPPPPGH